MIILSGSALMFPPRDSVCSYSSSIFCCSVGASTDFFFSSTGTTLASGASTTAAAILIDLDLLLLLWGEMFLRFLEAVRGEQELDMAVRDESMGNNTLSLHELAD